ASFKRIAIAYQTLIDASSKSTYDARYDQMLGRRAAAPTHSRPSTAKTFSSTAAKTAFRTPGRSDGASRPLPRHTVPGYSLSQEEMDHIASLKEQQHRAAQRNDFTRIFKAYPGSKPMNAQNNSSNNATESQAVNSVLDSLRKYREELEKSLRHE